MIGEFETMASCPYCGIGVFISVILTQADATGEGFYKMEKEECGDCGENMDIEFRLEPSWDITKE